MARKDSENQKQSMSVLFRGRAIFKPLNTGRIDEILCPPRRKNRRNTLCISRFLQRRRAQNLPSSVRGDLFSVSLRFPAGAADGSVFAPHDTICTAKRKVLSAQEKITFYQSAYHAKNAILI